MGGTFATETGLSGRTWTCWRSVASNGAPVGPWHVVLRDVVNVIEVLAGLDRDEHAVRGHFAANVETVRVNLEICGRRLVSAHHGRLAAGKECARLAAGKECARLAAGKEYVHG